MMERHELNVVALNAVLVALYGADAPVEVAQAYAVALAAVEKAYDAGYDDGFLDADPSGEYERGFRDGIDEVDGVDDKEVNKDQLDFWADYAAK